MQSTLRFPRFFALCSGALGLFAHAQPSELPGTEPADGLHWIWSQGKATPEAFFEKDFLLGAPPVSAQLRVSFTQP